MSRIACIGSRETPPDILHWMEEAGANLVKAGHTIVSGNAPGADQAWARGGNAVDPTRVELCLPWRDFEYSARHPQNPIRWIDAEPDQGRSAWKVAAMLHPRWDRLTMGARRLLARDVLIAKDALRVVGYLNHCKRGGGGTGFTFKVARHFEIETVDVSRPEIREAFDFAAINGPVFP